MRAPLRWASILCGAIYLSAGLPRAEFFAAAFLLAAGWLACALYPRLAKKYPSFAAKLPALALAGILAFAAAMRLRMSHMPVWIDEMITIHFCRIPWEDVARHLGGPRELMAPLTLFFYRFLYSFTHDPVLLRFVNVPVGTAAVYMAYRIGRLAHGRGTGLWFAFFLSCATYLTYFTVELRSYGMLLFLSFCSVYFFLRELRSPSVKGLRWYAYSTALMLYTHQAGTAIFVMQVAVWLAFWRPLRLQGRLWGRCMLFVCLMGSFAFWYEGMLKHGQIHYCLMNMYPGPHGTTFAELTEILTEIAQRSFFLVLFCGVALLAFLQRLPQVVRVFFPHPAQGLQEAVSRHYRVIALAAISLVPVLGLFFVRIEQRTLFYFSWRYLLPSFSLGCFFLGLAMVSLRGGGRRMWGITVAVMVLTYSFVMHWYNQGYTYYERMDISQESRVLRDRLRPGDRVAILMNESFLHLQVLNEFDKPVCWVTSPAAGLLKWHNDFRALDVRDEEMVASSRDLPPGQRVWVLVAKESAEDPSWRWLLADPDIQELESYHLGGKELYLFQRK